VKLVAECGQPVAEQPHGVSPVLVALADLALARVDFARGEVPTSRADVAAAAGVGVDDQAFAEDAIDTLYAIGDLTSATASADKAMATWPTSVRARLARAEILIAQGKAQDALDLVAKQADVVATPRGKVVRGEAKLALGDLAGAGADFDAALKQVPTLEPALVGRAWVDLAGGDVDKATQRIEPRYHAGASTAALTTVYAAILRARGDATSRDKAKTLLEKLVAGPPGLDIARAQLELARLDRDVGDFQGARAAYAEASKGGSVDATLEYGELLIEDTDPLGGHEVLDRLYASAGDHPSARLVLAVIRARMLAGDHQGAAQVIAAAAKIPGVPAWKLARERGRLALRKGDFATAASELSKALDGCGRDAETYLLAADAVTSDTAGGVALAAKIKKAAAAHLAGQPEAAIVQGKLLIASGKDEEAQPLFGKAKDALLKAKASSRRIAQARFGIAVTKYNLKHDAEAETELEVVRELDPSLYAADLYMADLLKDSDKKKAFEIAKHAVMLDPDLVQGWWMVGKLAGALHDRKQLANAIGRLGDLAPGSALLSDLQALRR
jgi:tetratricopeptide (TPR) repeat protein